MIRVKTHTEFYSSLIGPEKDFRNSNLIDLVLSLIRQGNLLDVGSGLGLLISKAHKKNIQVKGIEPDKKLIDLSEKFFGKLDVVNTSLETYNTHKKFDNVVMVDVLECIDDYKTTLIKAISLLQNDGRLIMVVPAYPSFFGSRDRMMKYFRRFDRNKFSLELDALGLRILKIRYWNMFGVVPYSILYKVLRKESHFENFRGGGGREGVFSKILYFWFKYVENNINFGFGLSLVFVAEKKSDPYNLY